MVRSLPPIGWVLNYLLTAPQFERKQPWSGLKLVVWVAIQQRLQLELFCSVWDLLCHLTEPDNHRTYHHTTLVKQAIEFEVNELV